MSTAAVSSFMKAIQLKKSSTFCHSLDGILFDSQSENSNFHYEIEIIIGHNIFQYKTF